VRANVGKQQLRRKRKANFTMALLTRTKPAQIFRFREGTALGPFHHGNLPGDFARIKVTGANLERVTQLIRDGVLEKTDAVPAGKPVYEISDEHFRQPEPPAATALWSADDVKRVYAWSAAQFDTALSLAFPAPCSRIATRRGLEPRWKSSTVEAWAARVRALKLN
jgi:hypothetical protein